MPNPTNYVMAVLVSAALYAAVFYLLLPWATLSENDTPFRWSIYRRLPNSFMVWPGVFAFGSLLIFSPISTPIARDVVGLIILSIAVLSGWHIGQTMARLGG